MLRSGLTIAALGIAGLALASCGDDESTLTYSDSPVVHTEDGSGATYLYLEDGSRLTDYDNELFSDMISTCDGPDLVDQTAYGYKSGNAPERSVGHPACADGVLTSFDFEKLG